MIMKRTSLSHFAKKWIYFFMIMKRTSLSHFAKKLIYFLWSWNALAYHIFQDFSNLPRKELLGFNPPHISFNELTVSEVIGSKPGQLSRQQNDFYDIHKEPQIYNVFHVVSSAY
jgi:hypothetical protein